MDEPPRDLDHLQRVVDAWIRAHAGRSHAMRLHSDITSAGFNRGHGDNPEVKRPYVKSMVALLERHEDELRAFLKGEAK